MQSFRRIQRVLHKGRNFTVVDSADEACMAANHPQRFGDSFTNVTILFAQAIVCDT